MAILPTWRESGFFLLLRLHVVCFVRATSRFRRFYSSFTLSYWKSLSDRCCHNNARFPTKLIKNKNFPSSAGTGPDNARRTVHLFRTIGDSRTLHKKAKYGRMKEESKQTKHILVFFQCSRPSRVRQSFRIVITFLRSKFLAFPLRLY